jgi:hypothetical protein
VVYAADEPGQSVVAALDPVAMMSLTGRDDIEPLANEVKGRMEKVLEAVAAGGR